MRGASKNKWLWIVWLAGSLVVGGAMASMMYLSGDRSALLIGQTTSAHHQIELTCDACHTAPFFASEKKVNKAMNKACLACHKDELEVSNDSHPVKKFRNPRNVARREILDALYCVTCHVEHKPEVTEVSAVTLPMDYCSACHQEIEEERPSHVGLGYETCASAGCHNYHDNTALYEKFLVKHADTPAMLEAQIGLLAQTARSEHPLRLALAHDNPSVSLEQMLLREGVDEDYATELIKETLPGALDGTDAVAPSEYLTTAAVTDWAESLHAASGVNCIGCHVQGEDQESVVGNTALFAERWIESPGIDVCSDCHRKQVTTFSEGKHGMAFHAELPPPRKSDDSLLANIATAVFPDKPLSPLQVDEARLPMKADAHDLHIGSCVNCHAPHKPDLRSAAVDACVGCHDDQHTQNYFTSAHYSLWTDELAGVGEAGTGVGCADCHMPKLADRKGRGFFTTHNQNSYLRPNEKMIRPVCLDCHGLAFAIDALADPELVMRNFSGLPAEHIQSIDWAVGAQKK